jgi:hypothetical protein
MKASVSSIYSQYSQLSTYCSFEENFKTCSKQSWVFSFLNNLSQLLVWKDCRPLVWRRDQRSKRFNRWYVSPPPLALLCRQLDVWLQWWLYFSLFSGVSERIIMGMPMKIGTGMISLLNKYPFILSKQSAMTWVLTPVVYRAHWGQLTWVLTPVVYRAHRGRLT